MRLWVLRLGAKIQEQLLVKQFTSGSAEVGGTVNMSTIMRAALLLAALQPVAVPRLVLAGQERATQPYEGLKSVADGAEAKWSEKHKAFRTLAAAAQTPCDAAVMHALDEAQRALGERTRAWAEFYRQTSALKDSGTKGGADLQAQLDEEIRATQANIAQSIDQLTELKRRRSNLDSENNTGVVQEEVVKAKKDLDNLIDVRQRSIDDSQKTVENDHEALRYAELLQQSGRDQAELARMYQNLVAIENSMYMSIYRGRETRWRLECVNNSEISPLPKPPDM